MLIKSINLPLFKQDNKETIEVSLLFKINESNAMILYKHE
ncbi:hypothetical protein JPSP43_23340 [Staphylococcus pseudintermedius]